MQFLSPQRVSGSGWYARVLFCTASVAFCPTVGAQSGTSYLITAFAGSGTPGFSGDGGPALYAQLNLVGYPSGVYGPNPASGIAVDGLGNVFIADTGNYRIREATPDGTIKTIAGTGTAGFSGDGGSAISAEFSSPTAITVDLLGNVYVLDQFYAYEGSNSRVRRITATGVIDTIAGNPAAPMQNGVSAASTNIGNALCIAVDTSGNLYVATSVTDNGANFGNTVILKVSAAGILTIIAEGSSNKLVINPPGVAYLQGAPITAMLSDSVGNLLFYDTSLRRLSAEGTLIDVTLPQGAQSYEGFAGMGLDSFGNLYIAFTVSHVIVEVTPGGVAAVIAGDTAAPSPPSADAGYGGPATGVALTGPEVLAADASGRVYFAQIDELPSELIATDQILELIPVPAIEGGCEYSIDSQSQTFGAAGGTAAVGVLTSASACPWLAVSDLV